MLDNRVVERLKSSGRNLLAFSGGVDSTALFFLLHEKKVEFALAIVDYNKRAQSKEEVAYAEGLGAKYAKQVYVKSAMLDGANFEAQARAVRYEFFDELIQKHGFEHLITAHQLNDRVEWFMMQLTKGAGLSELLGMQRFSKREGYTVARPLLNTSRKAIEAYLATNGIKHFLDESNEDNRFRRNYFRNSFTNELVDKFGRGIKKSLAFLEEEKNLLYEEPKEFRYEELTILKLTEQKKLLKSIDTDFKLRGYLLSRAQRAEIWRTKDTVIADKIAVAFDGEYAFIAPYVKIKLDKEHKEECRKERIPAKIRGYLKTCNISPKELRGQLPAFFGPLS